MSPPLDAMASASPHAAHDVPKKIRGLTRREKRGERLGGTGTKLDGSCAAAFEATATTPAGSSAGPPSDSRTQRRTKLALTPLAMATDAIETPGLQQAATT